MQVKLLRVVQEKAVRPVGATGEVQVDRRIVSATYKDLAALVGKRQFRQDLFYRINIIELKVPPLRERVSDIEALSRHFVARASQGSGGAPPMLAGEALSVTAGVFLPWQRTGA